MQALYDGEQGDAHTHGDVVTLGETVHGDAQNPIGQSQGFVAQSFQFAAEPEGHRPVQGDVVQRRPGWVIGGCGHQAVSPGAQVFGTPAGVVGLGVSKTVEVHPFGSPHDHLGVQAVRVPVFHDVDVLHPQDFRGAQGRAGVLGLVDVLQHQGHVTGAPGQDLADSLLLVLGDELAQIGDEFPPNLRGDAVNGNAARLHHAETFTDRASWVRGGDDVVAVSGASTPR